MVRDDRDITSGGRERSRDVRSGSEEVRVIHADGQRWVVREVSAPLLDRRGGTHLVFWCDSVMRRLRMFPANWNELSDEALYALTEHIATADTREDL